MAFLSLLLPSSLFPHQLSVLLGCVVEGGGSLTVCSSDRAQQIEQKQLICNMEWRLTGRGKGAKKGDGELGT